MKHVTTLALALTLTGLMVSMPIVASTTTTGTAAAPSGQVECTHGAVPCGDHCCASPTAGVKKG